MRVGWGMVGLVVRMELGSGMDWYRTAAGEDTVVVWGSHLVEGHSLVAGVEGVYWRNLVRGRKVSAKEGQRNFAEADKEIDFEEDIVVDLHSLAEGDNHPGYLRSNRCSTL